MVNMSTKAFNLYSTDGCHLCEQAAEMLVAAQLSTQVMVVDIVDDDALVEAYGIRIPVVKNIQLGTELGWPFEPEQLVEFLTDTRL
jgi:hypothetical protein